MAMLLSCSAVRDRRSRAKTRDKCRGSFAPEFALVAFPFFLLLMGIIELCLMEGAQQLLENVAFNTSRLAKTGYTAQNQTQAETINQIMVNEVSSYGSLIDPKKVSMQEGDYTSFSQATIGGATPSSNSYGDSSQKKVVVYIITYQWKLFTPLMCTALGSLCHPSSEGNMVNLTSTIVVSNEPYS
jgi:Flp pilus assembly protein TadG